MRAVAAFVGCFAFGCGQSGDSAAASRGDASQTGEVGSPGASGEPAGGGSTDASLVSSGSIGSLDARADAASAGAGASGAARGASGADARADATTSDASTEGHWVAYASGYGPDIQLLDADMDSGLLSPRASVPSFGTSPSFLAVGTPPTHLYAIDENVNGRVGAYAIDPISGELTFINAVSSGGQGPAFVSTDRTGRFVFVPNYTDGSVAVLPALANGSLGAVQQLVTDVGVNPHMMIADPTDRFVFVPCKGSDYVAQFTFDAASGAIAANVKAPHVSTAAMAGPRHLAFHPTASFAYLVNETNSTLSAYAFDPDSGTLETPPIDTQTTIAAGVTGNTAAEVWVDPTGRWVIVSNRGENSLAVFAVDASTGKMTFTERTSSGGATPRDFTFDASGTFVYVANQGSNDVVAFRFDPDTGGLARTGTPIAAAGASFIGLFQIGAR